MTPDDPIAQLEALLDRLDPDSQRVVVRWVDETRIRDEGDCGYTVAPTTFATFTLRTHEGVVQQRIDGISLKQIKAVLGMRPIHTLYRCDNITA